MQERTTLDLLTTSWYCRDDNEELVIQTLDTRGFTFAIRFLLLALLVPLIFIERLICFLGGDNWDDGPTTWRTILFSFVFSLYIILPIIIFVFLLFKYWFGVITSISLFIISHLLLNTFNFKSK